MKVWIVEETYDQTVGEIIAVYSTKEAADRKVETEKNRWLTVEEFEVDEP